MDGTGNEIYSLKPSYAHLERWCRDMAAEIDALKTERDALRAALEALVSAYEHREADTGRLLMCEECAPIHGDHASDCPIGKARAVLDAERGD